jgi:peptidylprolyl isomerase
MKFRYFLFISMTLLMAYGCRPRPDKGPKIPPPLEVKPLSLADLKAGEALVLISTTQGDIHIKLYAETPLHRDNFIKLAEKGFFDSLLFHRVIPKFVIQGGDPVSKHAKPNEPLGDGDVGYTVPSEIDQKLFHKRGALGAARESDFITPTRESSGCQFYIVQGKSWTDSLLKVQAKRIDKMHATNNIIRNPAHKILVERYKKYSEIPDSMKVINAELDMLIQEELKVIKPYVFSPEQVKAYTTIGGTPHLDNNYTVFGEVVQGMEVVDKIIVKPTNSKDRPLTDVRMISVKVLMKK